MKSSIISLFSSVFLPVYLYAQTPTLTHVFDIRAEIGQAINGGQNPHGVRVTIPITGGEVTGKIEGKVIPGGADYQLVNPDQQRSELQAIYTIMTEDSVAIHVCNEGINRFALKIYRGISLGLLKRNTSKLLAT